MKRSDPTSIHHGRTSDRLVDVQCPKCGRLLPRTPVSLAGWIEEVGDCPNCFEIEIEWTPDEVDGGES